MIKLNTALAGADFSHAAGSTVSLDKEFEARLVDSGQAEYVRKRRATKATDKADTNASESDGSQDAVRHP